MSFAGIGTANFFCISTDFSIGFADSFVNSIDESVECTEKSVRLQISNFSILKMYVSDFAA